MDDATTNESRPAGWPLFEPERLASPPHTRADLLARRLMGNGLDTAQGVWIAAGLTIVLAGLHLSAPRIRSLLPVPEHYLGSFAGGLSVAYVFLHLLPEIATGNEAVGESLTDVLEPTPLLELGIFLVALVGFTAFYGLERLAVSHGDRDRGPGTDSPGRPQARAPGAAGLYWLHLVSFMAYNGLITYTLALRARTGLLFALLFTVAMGLHFVITDRSLREHYPQRFKRQGRTLLAASLVAGWALSAASAPTSTLLVALLTALLGGAVLLNVFKEEIPTNRDSSFGWFATGLVFYSLLLALVTGASA